MLKYLNVHQCCELIQALAICGRGSDELIDAIENYIIKHRKALDDTDRGAALKGFRLLNKGSETLYEVLGQPDFKEHPKLV